MRSLTFPYELYASTYPFPFSDVAAARLPNWGRKVLATMIAAIEGAGGMVIVMQMEW